MSNQQCEPIIITLNFIEKYCQLCYCTVHYSISKQYNLNNCITKLYTSSIHGSEYKYTNVNRLKHIHVTTAWLFYVQYNLLKSIIKHHIFLIILNLLVCLYWNHASSMQSILIIWKSYQGHLDWNNINNNINLFLKCVLFQQ